MCQQLHSAGAVPTESLSVPTGGRRGLKAADSQNASMQQGAHNLPRTMKSWKNLGEKHTDRVIGLLSSCPHTEMAKRVRPFSPSVKQSQISSFKGFKQVSMSSLKKKNSKQKGQDRQSKISHFRSILGVLVGFFLLKCEQGGTNMPQSRTTRYARLILYRY